MRRRTIYETFCGVLALAATFALTSQASSAELSIEKTVGGAAVTIDGEPFATYVTKSGHQPVIWPIFGPGGQAMTRQYPLAEKLPTERDDHPHQRSLWFNHGLVNGKDFWRQPEPGGPQEQDNRIVHREFVELASGDTAKIVTKNDWMSGDVKVAEDVRKISFGADEYGRWIDFAVSVNASEGPLTFGDTKEGSFGLRVPGTMDVDAKLGGRILNSRGEKNEAAWGRPAEWVDYHGMVDGKPAGIVIYSMPDSSRHPTRWHVRTYGLFAANPFGQHDFPDGESKQGELRLAKDERLRLHYRVLLYGGEKSAEELAAIYKQYEEENHDGTTDTTKGIK